MTNPQAVEALEPCPFCGAGTTEIRPQKPTWNGGLKPPSEPISVSIWHWCEPVEGQPNRGFERIGRDEASAIAAWNQRATQPAPQPEAQALPPEWTPEMSRAVQLYSELGAYAASNLSGAYGLFEEFWNVAHRAAVSRLAPAPLSEDRIADLFTARTGLDPEESRERFIWYRRGVRHVVEHLGGIGLDGGM